MPSWLLNIIIILSIYAIIFCIIFSIKLYINGEDKYFNKLRLILTKDFEQKCQQFMIDNEPLVTMNKLADIKTPFNYSFDIKHIPRIYRKSCRIIETIVWFKCNLIVNGYQIEQDDPYSYNIVFKI